MKNILGLLSVGLVLSACGGKKGNLALNFVPTGSLSVTSFENPIDKLDLGTIVLNAVASLPTGAVTGLISYKVYFRSIQVCESIVTSGSGYSNPSGCATVYENSSDAYTGIELPTAAHAATFLAAGTGKYFDLLSATDRAALAAAAEIDAGDYNWGLMETHPWVKITAKSGTLCTKSGGTFVPVDQYSSYMQVASLDCGSGGPEEALVYMTNGNSSFKFANPLSVADGATVSAKIIYNLDDNIVAQTGTASNGSGALRSASSDGGSFTVPMFNATPMILAAGEALTKETYLFDITGTDFTSDQMRIDLYYGANDTTATPVAVTGSHIKNDGMTQHGSLKFDEVQLENTTTIKLLDYKGTVPVTFTRTAAGVASTGSGACGSGTTDPYYAACNAGASASSTFTLSDANGPTISTVE